MALTPQNFVGPISLAAVVLFGVFAIYLYVTSVKNKKISYTSEFFFTAKNSQPWYRVAWGFYACSVGAGVLYAVPGFVVDKDFGAGYLGLIIYALFSGLPFVIIAPMGSYIKKRFPEVLSIGSFAKWRFGRLFSTWVTIVVLFNLSIALAVEYTAIGGIFQEWIGWPSYVPIIVVAIVTMVYTAAGGLLIGLITDQFQSMAIILLLTIIGVFVSINFRIGPLPELPPYLDVNPVGYSSFATIGIALVCATVFSDAIWQRVWAAQDDKALYTGATVGFLLVTTVTGLIGFGGFIAAWAGLVTVPNLAFFDLVKVGGELPIGMLLLLVLIASIMNESAVDTFQLAIGDTVSSLIKSFGWDMSLMSSRAILALLNIPYAIIGTFQLRIIGLYLIANLLTTCLVHTN
jgi:Na+/proline symporter